eukprot:CAMPEP_0206528366 /NCGR_PEP_ID=MMETSP0325_2-20121206/1932_1 /ASSEMBLY_ACC=CAM_ASM_000347 /TAXON_ID=2866 /ORGANISM="Crypthecodinium cohnii, Strain Seligo" /LENGTH=130 /DNA_ID=CAMNT_0054024015 /DNA_START=974 /DNA_END=1362 /DNA_ORIENTATION=+
MVSPSVTAAPAAPPDSASPELELEEASVLFRPPLLESAAGDNGPNSPVGNDLERSMSEVSPAVGSRVILQMSPKVRERLSGWSQTNEDQATGGCVLDLPAASLGLKEDRRRWLRVRELLEGSITSEAVQA